MNETTKTTLEDYRAYWAEQPESNPFRDEHLADIELILADQNILPSDEKWDEYFTRLEGPEGCDFQEDEEGKVTWQCASGNDKTKSTEILLAMGMSEEEIATIHRLVDQLGGHCDCEIIFNAARNILPSRWDALSE